MAGHYFNNNSQPCDGTSNLIISNTGVSTSTTGYFFGSVITDCPDGISTDYPERYFIIKGEIFGPYNNTTNLLPPSIAPTSAPYNGAIDIFITGTILEPILTVSTAFSYEIRVESILGAFDDCGSCGDALDFVTLKWGCPSADFDIIDLGNGEFQFVNQSNDAGCPGGIISYSWKGYDADDTTILWTSNLINPPNYIYPLSNTPYKVELLVDTECCGQLMVKYLIWNAGDPVAAVTLDSSDCNAMVIETTGTQSGTGDIIEDDLNALYQLEIRDFTNNRLLANVSGFPYGGLTWDWGNTAFNLLSGTQQGLIEAEFSGNFGTVFNGNGIIFDKEGVFDVIFPLEVDRDSIELEFILTVTYLTKSSSNAPFVIAPICCVVGRHNLPFQFGNFDPAGNLYVPDYNGRVFRMIAPPRPGCSDCGWLKNIAGDPDDATGNVPADPAAGQVSGDLYRPNSGSIPSLVPDLGSTPTIHSVMGTVYPLFGHDIRGGYPVKLTPNAAVNDEVDWRKNWLIEKIDIPVGVTNINIVNPNLAIIPGVRNNGEPVLMVFNTDTASQAELSICYYDGANWIRNIIYTSPYTEIKAMYWDSQDNGIVFSHSTPLGGGAGPPQLLSYLEFSGTKDITGLTNPANYSYRDINRFTLAISPIDATTVGIIDIGTTDTGKPVLYFTRNFNTDVIYEARYNGGATGTETDWDKSVKYTDALEINAGLAWDGVNLYLGRRDGIYQLDYTVDPFDKIKDYTGLAGSGGTTPVTETKKF